MREGGLVPDPLILNLILSELKSRKWVSTSRSNDEIVAALGRGNGSASAAVKPSTDPSTSFILDGFPRTASQAEYLSHLLPMNLVLHLVTPVDIKIELNNPNVLPSSFISIPVDVQLIPRNGVIIFPAGTPLNYDLLGTCQPNAIKTNVRYTYQIPNIIGDDSTQGSNRVTVWFQRMLFQTDKFETNQIYPLNANLFVSEVGLLTTRQPAPNYPAVAIVTAPPTPILGFLEALWL